MSYLSIWFLKWKYRFSRPYRMAWVKIPKWVKWQIEMRKKRSESFTQQGSSFLAPAVLQQSEFWWVSLVGLSTLLLYPLFMRCLRSFPAKVDWLTITFNVIARVHHGMYFFVFHNVVLSTFTLVWEGILATEQVIAWKQYLYNFEQFGTLIHNGTLWI